MITGRNCFNTYLLLACAALVAAAGCRTRGDDDDKKMSTLRLHMEVSETPAFSTHVPIYRQSPVMINVDKDPFLSEVNVESAEVVDAIGGFALQIEFDHEGALLLENYTTANPGRRIAIFAMFGKSKEESRWLGAPRIGKRITDGVLAFTPDATRAEAERIALGLNNVHKEILKKNKW